MAEPEKRAHKRTTVSLPVRLRRADGAEIEGTVDNIGSLGALVSTPNLEAALVEGEAVSLRIEGNRGAIDVGGEILRIDQEFTGNDIRRTIAVRFEREVQLES